MTVELVKEISIRAAVFSDLEQITAIYNQAIQSGWATGDIELQSPEDKTPWFLSHKHEQFPLLVAESEKQLKGWLSLSPYREGRAAFRFAAEVSYYTDFGFHRSGIASALMEAAELHCKENGIKTLIAFLLEHNTASIAFLTKFGFSLWGKLPQIANLNDKEYDHLFYGKQLL